MAQPKTTQEFIEEIEKIHGDKYDYSKIEYKNNCTKVCVVCKKHGDFYIRPDHLINGGGCKECFKEKQSERKLKTNEQFITSAQKIHGDKYDYTKTIYKGYRFPVNIICPIHGEFSQNAGDHLKGCGCQKCGKVIMWDNRGRMTTDDFINKAKQIHGDKYDYKKVNYINAKTPITITCKKHGDFLQTPSNHLLNCGCPSCSKSKMVNEVIKILSKKEIKYCLEKTFEWLCIDKNKLRIDIFLPDYNVGIECQGLQHFVPIDSWGGIEQFKKQKLYDETKFSLCKENKIKLLYYTNLHDFAKNNTIYDNINDLLKTLNYD